MRKKITLLVAVLVGLLAFGVACSPALSDQPVADPHGTPEQQWTWWRETYATKDYNQADLASYRELSDIPQCGMEDGSTRTVTSVFASGVEALTAIIPARHMCS